MTNGSIELSAAISHCVARARPLASFGIAFATGWLIAKIGSARSDK